MAVQSTGIFNKKIKFMFLVFGSWIFSTGNQTSQFSSCFPNLFLHLYDTPYYCRLYNLLIFNLNFFF